MSDPEDQIRLALNLWHNGQILQPEHFLAEEQALLGQVCQTGRLAGLPFYGVAQLAWDEALLAKGTVSLTALTVVFESGELVKLHSNATVADVVLDAPGAAVTLYLHLSNKTVDATGMDLYRDDKRWVTRVVHELVVSTDSSIDDARQPMKLAVLAKQAGQWQLSPAYVPPLLRVGTSPFLRDLLARLAALLEKAQLDLREEINAAAGGPEANATRRRCQAAAYRLRTLLADLDRQIHLHPYLVLEALRAFYLEACLLQDKEPAPFAPETYDHDDLAGAFNAMEARIDELLQGRPSVSPERLEFKRREGGSQLVAGPFPPRCSPPPRSSCSCRGPRAATRRSRSAASSSRARAASTSSTSARCAASGSSRRATRPPPPSASTSTSTGSSSACPTRRSGRTP